MRSGLWVPMLFAVATGALHGCASHSPETSTAVVALDWRIDGGIAGRGDGSLGVRGAEVVASDAGGRLCTGRLEREEAEELTRLVGAIEPGIWGSKLLVRGADFFTYELKVETEQGVRELVWNDGAELPPEVLELRRFIQALKQRIAFGCPLRGATL